MLRWLFRARHEPRRSMVVIATRDACWCDPITTRLEQAGVRVHVADTLDEACVEVARDPRSLLLVDSLVLVWPGRVRVLRPVARRQPVLVAGAADHLHQLVELSFQLGVVGVVPRALGPDPIAGSVQGVLAECLARGSRRSRWS